MALPNKRFAAARAGRRLQVDQLESRQLLSVNPTQAALSAVYDPAAYKLGESLAEVNNSYRAFVAANPGKDYQVQRTDLTQSGQFLSIEAVASGDTSSLVTDLLVMGGRNIATYGRYVDAYLPLAKIHQLPQLSSLQYAYAVSKPQVHTGQVTSQADVAHHANVARPTYAVDGSGVTVGVLSDSFDSLGTASIDRATGDLPPIVQVLDDLPYGSGGSDEGRAMLQLIHDLAPGANLAFASAFTGGQATFARNIQRLANEANADVIVDDVQFFAEPMFQDGIIAQSVDSVKAQGISYFSSAGNSDSLSYENRNWNSVRSFYPAAGENGQAEQFPQQGMDTIDPSSPDDLFHPQKFFLGGDLLAFAGSDDLQKVTIPEDSGWQAILQWDQPYFSLTGQSPLVDLDFYLLSEDGTAVVASSTNTQVDPLGNPTGVDPWELLRFINLSTDTVDATTFSLAIVKRYAETERQFFWNGPARPIPETDNSALSATINVNQPGAIRDLDLSLDLVHPLNTDLTVTLIGPDGQTMVDVIDSVGGSGFIGTTLDDQAPTIINLGSSPFTGSYQPSNPLNDTFATLSATGPWTLQIVDGEGNNLTGLLRNWSLKIRTDHNPQEDPGLLKYVIFGGGVPDEFFFGSSTLYGHTNAAGANSVGAVPYFLANGFGDNPIALEGFSSEGDIPILFDNAGQRLAFPVSRVKPDILGIDGTNTTFFPSGPRFFTDIEQDGYPNFFGTSAAAPHVAAIAALMKQAVPDATPDEIQAALQGSSLPVPGSNAGLAQADLAIGLLSLDRVGSISGQKFNDLNGDGVRQPNEPPLPGFQVFLDQNNSGTPDDAMTALNSDRVPLKIFDNTVITSEIFALGIPAVIKDVSVTLDIDHTADGDLTMTLISPAGDRVRLSAGIGGTSDNFTNTTFDTNPLYPLIAQGVAPFSGTFQPIDSLEALVGQNPNGVWRLEVRDSRGFNVGTLKSWSLKITYTEPVAVTGPDGSYTFPNLPLGGYRVADLVVPNDPGWSTSDPGNVGRSSPVLFSEIDPGNVDAFELTNYSRQDQDTSGWKVLISDSPYGQINDVNSTIWALPHVVHDGQVVIATDSPSNNYFGSNIFWNKNNTRIGSGWAMLVDNEGHVRDWVGWGWTAEDLDSFNITVPALQFGGKSFHVGGLDGIWNGNAVDRTGDGSIQRRGNQDRNVSTDFIWYAVPSVGAFNVSPRPDFIINDNPDSPTSRPIFVKAGQHVTGIDIGDQYQGAGVPPGLPAVQDNTPAGPTQGPVSSLQFRFTEPMDPSSFSLDDILSFTGPNQRVLDSFLAQPNPAYRWSLHSTLQGLGFKAYILDFTSQTWRTAAEVNDPVWHHWLTVMVPDVVKSDTALLLVDGGNKGDGPPTLGSGDLQQLAQFVQATGTVAVHLPNVPNQPLQFSGDALTTGNRSEDEIIASSFEMALRTGDPTWAALLPMVRSAVKAMDATQELTSELADPVTVSSFVITGASKRGWTTWLTGAADPRVKAIMPMVFDALNMPDSFQHHGQVYSTNPFFTVPSQVDPSRQYSEAIEDYVDYGIVDLLDSPQADQLAQIVDPYTYRDRLTMPKYDVVSAGDEFFLNDSTQFYFDALPGQRYLRYIPNTGHGLNQSAVEGLTAFYKQVLDGDPLPSFSWTMLPDGSIQVQTGSATKDVPATVRLWQANNPNFDDFRHGLGLGPVWTSTVLSPSGTNQYLGQVTNPLPGYTAFLVELTYNVGEAYPLTFTTEVRVLNDGSPLPRANVGSDTDGGPAIPLDPPTKDLKDQITGYQWSADGLTLTVFFDPQSAEGNYQMTLGPDIRDLEGKALDQNQDGLAGQAGSDDYTATFATRSEITGVRFSDINGDGIQQVDEPGLAGLRLYLDLDHDGVREADEPSTLTDDQGHYSFSLLVSGSYTVAIELRAGFTPTSPASGRSTINLGESQVLSNVNFGEKPSATVWQPQGPNPILGGQVEGQASQGNPVVGAIQTLAASPGDADVLYVGTVNGGIWKTTNARGATPIWIPLTDSQQSLSIGALEFDPTDLSDRTLVAGIGRFSSFYNDGGERTGLLRTSNAGLTWQSLGADDLGGKNISGVAPRGSVITVGVDLSTNGPVGIYRSIDNGLSFALVSGIGGTGLPPGPIADLVGDPTNSLRLYAGVTGAGLFRSEDGGATWTNITAGVSGINASNDKIEFAVQRLTGVVYAAIIDNGQLHGVYRSENQGGIWVRMDLPVTNEEGELVGVNPDEPDDEAGGQGGLHFSIVADYFDPFVVFVGGDRQPAPFPNSIGANDYSGRLFRGDAAKLPGIGAQWRPVTHDFAQGTAPHADSREMVFAADGSLIETDDGGIYRLNNATSNSTDIRWESLNGNLQITEFHSVDFDANTRTIVGGAQDVGTSQQSVEGNRVWQQSPVYPVNEFGLFATAKGDGGVVAIDDSNPNQSVRYGSAQYLGFFSRQYYNKANTLLQTQFPTLTVLGTGGKTIDEVDAPQFYTPVVLNAVEPLQLVIGTTTHVFESFDQGDNLVDLGSVGPIRALAYGGNLPDAANPGSLIPNSAVLYVGAGADLYLRSTAGGKLTSLAAYPGGEIRDIVLDPADWRKVSVIDSSHVWSSTNAGVSWADVTGNLSVGSLRTIEMARYQNLAVLLVGGDRGVAQTLPSAAGTWTEVGNLPNAPVTDLHYDSRGDFLLAGTLGRGAWGIADYLYQLGANRQPQAADDSPTTNSGAPSSGPVELDSIGSGSVQRVANANPAGGFGWYSFTAAATGTVSVAAQAGQPGSAVQLSVFDGRMQPLAQPVGGASTQQVNLAVQAGKTYYVQVGGTSAGVGLSVGSPISRQGSSLTIQGTSGNDTLSVITGSTLDITFNGFIYSYSAADVQSVSFVSGGGRDSVTVTGGPGSDTATLAPGSSQLKGAGYQVNVSGAQSVVFLGGGGNDSAVFSDSAGNDVLTARPGESTLTGDNFSLTARGFASVRATATAGLDQANLFDTAGDDQFTARPNLAQMVGGGYFASATGFDSVRAYGSTGNDTAVLYDSAGDDQFAARPTYAQLSGVGYSNYVRGFDSVRALASTGNDSASLYDSAGNDQLIGRADFTQLSGGGYFYLARGFDAVRSYGSTGFDTAVLYDSSGDDQLIARPDYAQLSGSGFMNYVKSFDEVRSISASGKDSADLYDSSGSDQYMARPDFAQLLGAGYYNSVRGFSAVRTHSSGGGDQATVYGATPGAVLRVEQGSTQLTSGAIAQTLTGFQNVSAYASSGVDRAQLADAALQVSLAAGSDRVQVTDRDARVYLYNFRTISSDSPTQASLGTRKVTANDFLFSDEGDWTSL